MTTLATVLFSFKNCVARSYLNLGRVTPSISICTSTVQLQSAKSTVIEKPTRPLTSFLRYVQLKRPETLKLRPDFKPKDVVRHLSASWKTLAADKKKIYEDEYIANLEQYRLKEDKWWQSLSQKDKEEYVASRREKRKKREERRIKKTLRSLKKPTRPRSGFNFYVKENYHERGSVSQKEYLKKLVSQWKTLPEKDKEHYMEQSLKDKERYDDEMKMWELKMIRDGYGDLVRQSVTKPTSTRRSKARDDASSSDDDTLEYTEKKSGTNTKDSTTKSRSGEKAHPVPEE